MTKLTDFRNHTVRIIIRNFGHNITKPLKEAVLQTLARDLQNDKLLDEYIKDDGVTVEIVVG